MSNETAVLVQTVETLSSVAFDRSVPDVLQMYAYRALEHVKRDLETHLGLREVQ